MNFNGSGFTEIIRYCAAGLLATLVDLTAMAILLEVLGFVYWLAAGIGFVAGLTTAYLLSIFFVFKGYQRLCPRSELTVFLLIGLVGIGLNELIIVGLVEAYHADIWLAKAVSIVVVTAFNFSAKKYLLFNQLKLKNKKIKTV